MTDPIKIPVKKEPAQVSIVLPEPVVQANNHEVKANHPIWMVFILTITKMILVSIIICFLFYKADGIGLGVLLSLCFSLWLWNRESRDSKLIISGDYAAIVEIERRYDVLSMIAKFQNQLANRQLDIEWEDMGLKSEHRLQELINDAKVVEAREQASHYKRISSEYDLHRQSAWESEENEPTTEEIVREKFHVWLADVYEDTEPVQDQPWSASGSWTREEKEYAKHKVSPAVMRASFPLFTISKDTGWKPRFDFQTYPSKATAENFMEDIWMTI